MQQLDLAATARSRESKMESSPSLSYREGAGIFQLVSFLK
jgi:hypothetical protein